MGRFLFVSWIKKVRMLLNSIFGQVQKTGAPNDRLLLYSLKTLFLDYPEHFLISRNAFSAAL